MSAAEIIEQIKGLPAKERVQVPEFVVGGAGMSCRRKFSVATEADGLPVIRANGRTITSQLVHEIEGLTP